MYLPTGVKLPETLEGFAPTAFKGESPARRDLVEGRLPRGKLVVLAGEGDIGKSWLLLELFEAINNGGMARAFGGKVVQGGLPCVILSGEDDFSTTDRRLRTIRQGAHAAPAKHGAIVTAPDLGVMHLVRRDFDNAIKPTDVFEWLDRQLQVQREVFGELGFVAVDTMSTFLPVNANAPEEVQGSYAALNHLAAKHDVCVIVTHHVAKGSDHRTRAAIRGSTAVVDGARAAYVFHRLEATEAEQVREACDMQGEAVRLQIVKNNLGLDRTPITYIRRDDGSLADVSSLVAMSASPEAALARVVAEAWEAERPLSKSGKEDGVYARRDSTWPGGLGSKGRNALQSLVDSALARGLIQSIGGALAPVPA